MWNRVAVSISYDDNHYTTGTSFRMLWPFHCLTGFVFLRLVSSIHKNSIGKLTARRISKVAYLIKMCFGHIKEPSTDGVVFNLFTFRPTEFESLILAHGLDFCVPFRMPDREKVFADIEVLCSRLARLKPSSYLASSDFKAKLNSLAHTFSGMSVTSE